ncbi:phosphotransferase [Stackebrandtia nassauensis]|uniref:Mn2+dependent serine/threonine protein kinase n=1 Tax=Stackebrandtia nassauensis (strain DSM 44728 / CIP 108903 / NRRL B-16338 / NBRC 102104 / LLR-40K-21) TaxID=446470 RepID=D3Q7N0_STANL|nr:phosphotransferase [Stackebrandtia nassauensis]ADD44372.1 Mn2+dependent serine/threonine protein kinase [Stackebrandtia nassauensis DSM 44728]
MELLAQGRDADVYALDDERVLRRCRHGEPSQTEIRIQSHVRQAGYPVPEIFDVSGRDIVMERLHGPSLMETMLDGAEDGVATLAEVHNRLHELSAPDWLRGHDSGGDRIAHLDLHPANVIVTESGPVVIDWTNAVAAHPGLDVADTIVVLSVAIPDGVDLAVLDAGRRRLTEEFAAKVDHDPNPWLPTAIRQRMVNPNLKPAEGQLLRDWLSELES